MGPKTLVFWFFMLQPKLLFFRDFCPALPVYCTFYYHISSLILCPLCLIACLSSLSPMSRVSCLVSPVSYIVFGSRQQTDCSVLNRTALHCNVLLVVLRVLYCNVLYCTLVYWTVRQRKTKNIKTKILVFQQKTKNQNSEKKYFGFFHPWCLQRV